MIIMVKIKEILFIEDLIDAINNVKSMNVSEKAMNKIKSFKDGTLVEIVKDINKGTIILEVNEITDEYISKM